MRPRGPFAKHGRKTSEWACDGCEQCEMKRFHCSTHTAATRRINKKKQNEGVAPLGVTAVKIGVHARSLGDHLQRWGVLLFGWVVSELFIIFFLKKNRFAFFSHQSSAGITKSPVKVSLDSLFCFVLSSFFVWILCVFFLYEQRHARFFSSCF